jgi:hypothetical protein
MLTFLLAKTLLAHRKYENSTVYKWIGYIDSIAEVSSLGFGNLTTNVSVIFDSVDGSVIFRLNLLIAKRFSRCKLCDSKS